ncbi:MAG: FAD-dependent oxidoreductase [Bacilli bacterium]|nr:FAD-dependent oxidoreductase [Bacilli bacterium]MDD4719097.1 FAD-dependent oxidoreductase [Bacilli bacterium]
MESIWMKDYVNKNIPSIKEDLETPILIIGGGIAGLMCAYNLMKNNIKFILIDGRKIAKGVSSKTTAQISVAHDKIYDDIKSKHNEEKAVSYLKSQMEGFEIINKIIKNENINCDYKEESTIMCASEKKTKKTLNEQFKMIRKHNNNVKLLSSSNTGFTYEKLYHLIDKKILSNNKYSKFQLKSKILDNFISLGYSVDMIHEIFDELFSEDSNIIQKEYDKLYNNLKRKYSGDELFIKIKQKLYQKGYQMPEIIEIINENLE